MKNAKSTRIILLLFSIITLSMMKQSYAQVIPAVSPLSTVTQRVGVSDISINYSRPQVKGREIWGGLVPHGYTSFNLLSGTSSSPWRAGANATTIIDFPDDVKINGQHLKAGKYSLTMAIYENGFVDVIFSEGIGGAFFYEKEKNALVVKVGSEDIIYKQEMLTFEFFDVTSSTATIALIWDKKKIPFGIEVDTHTITLKGLQADEYNFANAFNPTWKATAAGYFMTNNVFLEEGLKWAEQSVSPNWAGIRNFVNLTTYANLLLMTGDAKRADTLITEAIALPGSNAGIMNFYGGQVLRVGEGFPDVSIRVFNELQKLHPKNEWRVKNGLAKAYSFKGEFKTALKHLQNAKQFAPDKYNKETYEANIKKLKNNETI